MRGTEGYTGRYVWKLSVLCDLGRKRRGAAAPCIHWEDPVLNMASGICKAYIRGALASDWFWNKFSQALWASQAKVVLAVNRSLCLTSTWSSPIHLESSWSLTRSGRSFTSEREWVPQHSHVQNALGLKQGHPSACRHVLVEDLASICTKKPSLSKSLHSFLIHVSDHPRLASNERLPEMNGLGALLLLRRATVLSEVNKLEWEWESELLIHCLIVKCVYHATHGIKATKVGLCNQVGILHKWQHHFHITIKIHWYSFDINTISQSGV